jgi:protease PrsW
MTLSILLLVALGPVAIILFYIYYRDKYEKEPVKLLLKGLLFGALSVIPIIVIEKLLMQVSENPIQFLATFFSLEESNKFAAAAYEGFFVAAFTEELFKFFAVLIAVWNNKEFNEKFDGIVYAVFVSLGFAAVENIMYVAGYGIQTGILRALTAVPAHAIFGIMMGYYLGLAKFIPEKRAIYMILALVVPIFFHGFYDFILMAENHILLLAFIPLLVFMLIWGLRKMKRLSNASIFKTDEKDQ